MLVTKGWRGIAMSKHLSARAAFFTCVVLLIFALRAVAAEISDVTISDITDNTATIQWHTDVNTDATINYGLDSSVGLARDPTFTSKDHTLTIQDLDPSTTYHFRVVSTDVDGNTSATAGLVFKTKGEPASGIEKISDREEKALTEKIIADIGKLSAPESVIAIAEKVKKVAGDVLKPPVILGATKVFTETRSAHLSWTTDRDASSVVYGAPENEYNASSKNPYSITQGDPKERVKKHSVTVIGLEPSTLYHFQVVSEDSLGLHAETGDDTFKTHSLQPEVSNVRVTRVQETAATISWSTGGVLAKGLVSYTNVRTRATKSQGNPVFAKNHSIQLTGLEFGTRYSAIVSSISEDGQEVQSSPVTFVTVRDIVPPAISKVNNESTLFPGEDTKIQTILSWETDEPSTCQVFYTQGLVRNEGDEGDALPPETNPVTTHTQVIVGFAPATVYKFWMRCNDPSRNESQSEDFVLITPIKEKNIIDIILENFQGTFGWVNNIGK